MNLSKVFFCVYVCSRKKKAAFLLLKSYASTHEKGGTEIIKCELQLSDKCPKFIAP